mmetsp:Transcript_12273/g.25049  ORF Transcript_12273/g.25049 Transcript_12273/m.25049 type:complete len:85 (-) Transcript_12273:2677-2931(-)
MYPSDETGLAADCWFLEPQPAWLVKLTDHQRFSFTHTNRGLKSTHFSSPHRTNFACTTSPLGGLDENAPGDALPTGWVTVLRAP